MDDEKDDDQKTEEASPRRLEQLREEGRAVRSADVGAAAALLAGLLGLAVIGAHAAATATRITQRALSLRDVHAPMQLVEELVAALLTTAVPVAFVVAIAAMVAGLAQSGGNVTWAELAPKLERLDPLQGIKKVVPGPQVLLEIGKTLLKVAAISYVVWGAVQDALPRLVLLARSPAAVAAGEVRGIVTRLAIEATLALALIACLDFFLAWRKFHRDARMTKQELKDEHKQQEGDPLIKAKRRARARQIARQRALGEVKNATVVITNPTHLAIVLRYVPGEDAAPLVLAKGEDELALKMREEARRHGVPIVENRPLARAMYPAVKVGRPIPVELYEAVAGIVAHVLRLRGAIARS